MMHATVNTLTPGMSNDAGFDSVVLILLMALQ